MAFTPVRTLILLGATIAVVSIGAVVHHENGDTAPARNPAGVVSFTGIEDVQFGTSSRELARDHGMVRRPEDCGPTLPRLSLVTPVLVNDKLALLWVSPPVHTPEGITVGSPVSQVRSAYPQATEVSPPSLGQYPALLVSQDDRAYLFLYSQDQVVRKLLVGYRDAVEQLYRSGADTC